eukprot:5121232-Pyramimonas_sp.AAC.1
MEVHELAASQIADFPAMRSGGGALKEDALLMSDAWASARWAQRASLVSQRLADVEYVADLRRQ